MSLPPPSIRQAKVIWLATTGLAFAMLVALGVALVWGLGVVINRLSPVLWPLALAGVLAYLLDPMVDGLERRRIPRGRAILCVFALALCIIALVFSLVVPRIVLESRELISRIPDYVERVQTKADYWLTHPPDFLKGFLGKAQLRTSGGDLAVGTNASGVRIVVTNALSETATETNAATVLQNALGSGKLDGATSWVTQTLPGIGSWLFGQVSKVASWFGVLAGLALVPVYLFYFLLEKRKISSKWADYVPVTRSAFKEEVVFIINSINSYLIAFFRGQVLVAICDGVMYGLGFLIIGLPYAVLLGAIAVPLTMIPFLGAIITCIAALIIAFVQSGSWSDPALVLLVFAVVQGLEGTVVAPKIMGDRVNLHPVTIIVAVMAGTTLLGGILGGVLAIPLTAALRVIMFRYIWRRPVHDGVVDSEPLPARPGAS